MERYKAGWKVDRDVSLSTLSLSKCSTQPLRFLLSCSPSPSPAPRYQSRTAPFSLSTTRWNSMSIYGTWSTPRSPRLIVSVLRASSNTHTIWKTIWTRPPIWLQRTSRVNVQQASMLPTLVFRTMHKSGSVALLQNTPFCLIPGRRIPGWVQARNTRRLVRARTPAIRLLLAMDQALCLGRSVCGFVHFVIMY